jgi:hypothetical protein
MDGLTEMPASPFDRSSLIAVALSASLAMLPEISDAGASADTERVPFVGCASDGQVGPTAAPRDNGTAPILSRFEAKALAYYTTDDIGVLAPRGWHCLGLAGSNGSTLIVTPESRGSDGLHKPKTPLTGPAVQITLSNGGTSGRFEVAQVAARLFPNQSAFVQRVVAEGTMPRSEFPVGPYPHDIVRRMSERTVEFETPPGQQGMGTSSRLGAGDNPIAGLAIMPVDQDNSLVLVDVRLPSDSKQLTDSILAETKKRFDAVLTADGDPTVNQIFEAARNGHLDRAQRMIDRVLRDHPDSAKAHYVQAEIYAAEGHRDLARSELARAEQLNPGLPDVKPRSVQELKVQLGLPGG